ncbi:MAG: galactokinase [Pseudomonadota bacterium]
MSARHAFQRAFGRAPDAVASAPGRVNLIGEHIDYNGGLVLPAALPQRVDVALGLRSDARIRVASSRFEQLADRSIGEPASGDWSDYALGALAKARDIGWITGGADLYIESAVPDGAGVSSSAALATAALRAAAAAAGETPDPVALARHARSVENDFIGMPCGIMDQMAVGLAEPGQALALDTKNLSVEILPIPEAWAFVTLHSGVRRELSDGRYKRRFEECLEAKERLGADDLCLLSADQRRRIDALPTALAKRARHAVSEHRRSQGAVAALKAADQTAFGALMDESHRSYSYDFEASTPEIDALVGSARSLGALGARLTGGGFGGCIVCLVSASNRSDWIAELTTQHPETWLVSG